MTSKRFASIAALVAAPLLAMAAPKISHEAQDQGMCHRVCNCQVKGAEAEARPSGLDFFTATQANPVP